MRHEDFTSLELDDVLTKVLSHGREVTKSSAVHWISAHGLARIHDSEVENWHWAFAAADVIGTHMWSQPASDLWSLYQLWSQVDQLFPRPWNGDLSPQVVTVPHARFVYPVMDNGALMGILAFDNPKATSLETLVKQVKPVMGVALKYLKFAYQYFEARNMAYVDEVTGLHNQRYLPHVLEHEIQRAKREKTAFSLMFLDIDFFKMVNYNKGHWVGSKLLIELGRVLKDQIRNCDYAFRYGGDEFIILLANANVQQAQAVAERVRRAVEKETFRVEGHTLNLTVSIGLAGYPDHAQTAAGLIQIADQAMYYGKRKSRNIVFVAS